MVTTNTLNQPQPEDLSETTGKPQAQGFGVPSDQYMVKPRRPNVADDASSCGNALNVPKGRRAVCFIGEEVEPVLGLSRNMEECVGGNGSGNPSSVQTPRPWAMDSGQPSSNSTEPPCIRTLVTMDVDSWLSESMESTIPLFEKRTVPEKPPSEPSRNQNTHSCQAKLLTNTAQLHGRNSGVRTGASLTSAASTPSSQVQAPNSGTFSDGRGGQGASTASLGPRRIPTVFIPPVGASTVPQRSSHDVSSKVAGSFQSAGRADSLGSAALSSSMFARTPVLPIGVRRQGLAGRWPTPLMALSDPSPVATVAPQIHMAVGKPEQRETQANAENIPSPVPRRRKRKRRSVFGARRRAKRSQRSTSSAPHQETCSVGSDPTSNPAIASSQAVEASVVVGRPVPVAKAVDTAESATSSSLVRPDAAAVGANPMSNTPSLTKQSAASLTARTGQSAVNRALKPIDNQPRGSFMTTNNHGPATTQRNATPLGSCLAVTTGRTSSMTPYRKWQRRRSSTDAQKVPSSPERDIFEFCGDEDDDDSGPDGLDWLTPSSMRSTSTQSTQRYGGWRPPLRKPFAVTAATATAAHQKPGQAAGSFVATKLR